MVQLFMEFQYNCHGKVKFELEEDLTRREKEESEYGFMKKAEKFFMTNVLLSGKYERNKKDILNYYRIFRAKSTPCYLISKFQIAKARQDYSLQNPGQERTRL